MGSWPVEKARALLFELSVVGSELSHPDVSKSNRVLVVLEFDGASRLVGSVLGDSLMSRRSDEFLSVMDHDAVVDHRDPRFLNESLTVKPRCLEDDVIDLPGARRAARVDEWWFLAVDGRRLSIRVRWVVMGVENLDLVSSKEKDSAVAPPLGLAFNPGGGCPFDVELAVAKVLSGLDVAGAVDFHETVFDFPGGFAVSSGPLGEVGAVKENNRVAGWFPRELGSTCCSGHDDSWLRSCSVVDSPFGVWQFWSVRIAQTWSVGRCSHRKKNQGVESHESGKKHGESHSLGHVNISGCLG